MKRSAFPERQQKKRVAWSIASRLFMAAIALHLALTAVVFSLGRKALLPGTFDANGIAISFANDGVGYREDATKLAETLWNGSFNEWLSAAYPVHVKLYSICFAFFGTFLGFNILSAEPLNLFYYLGILIFVYKLGSEIFGARAALIGSGIVALWPSFALHTTQLLKDQLFIVGMLALIFIMMGLLLRPCSWLKSLLQGAIGASIAAVLWRTRSDMGTVLVATILLGAVALIIRYLQLRRARRASTSNLGGMAFLTLLTVSALFWLPVYRDADHPSVKEAASNAVVKSMKPKPVVRWWQLPVKIGIVRERFAEKYPDARSNIDTNVTVTGKVDLVRYLPRAMEIGLFAPFPNMWFEAGSNVGSMGRILSGLETLLMYAIEMLAVVGLWRGRRNLSVWFLFSIAAMGIAALGLAVSNIGTLYRLRYLYLILLIIPAAGGIEHLFYWFMRRRGSSLIS